MGPAPFLTFPRRFALKVFFAGLNPSKNLWSGLAFPTPSSSAIGGDEQIRTVDPLLARQVLSHLSYTPIPIALTSSPLAKAGSQVLQSAPHL